MPEKLLNNNLSIEKYQQNMENKNNVPVFTFTIAAIIVGAALYKQFDFVTLKFEKPALVIVYFIVFAFSIFVLIKNFKKRAGK